MGKGTESILWFAAFFDFQKIMPYKSKMFREDVHAMQGQMVAEATARHRKSSVR